MLRIILPFVYVCLILPANRLTEYAKIEYLAEIEVLEGGLGGGC
jgi:hypothetical protein